MRRIESHWLDESLQKKSGQNIYRIDAHRWRESAHTKKKPISSSEKIAFTPKRSWNTDW